MIKTIFKVNFVLLAVLTSCALFASCDKSNSTAESEKVMKVEPIDPNLQIATFGGGCFWCVEAIYQNIEGVEKVVSGYSGGKSENPTYREVCSGTSGHAEVIQIHFDDTKVSFAELLEIFWETHDPTTLNRQGADVGTQYRSVVFYHDDEQKRIATLSKEAAEESEVWADPIVTEISPLTEFYAAEDYHQNYFNENGNQPYCSAVILPKVEKFKKKFQDKLKESK